MNKGLQIEVFEILLWELLRVKTFFWEEVGDQTLGKTFVAAMGEAFNFLCRAETDVHKAGCRYGSHKKT